MNMLNVDFEQIKEAINQGSYSTAYKFGNSIIQSGNASGEVLAITTLAQIVITNLEEINATLVSSDLSFALGKISDSYNDIEKLEKVFTELLKVCEKVHTSLKANYSALDQQLKSQYKGAAGF